MLSKRSLTLTALMLLPLLIYALLGAYALWHEGLLMWTWLIPIGWLFTGVVALIWKAEPPSKLADKPTVAHWTPRDEEAFAIVRRYQVEVDELTAEELTDPKFYLEQSQRLARDLALHYHPHAKDPVSSLTVPEVLAAGRLALDDMERWMLDTVPGSQLVTIRQWRWLRHAPKWVQRVQDSVWAASMIINPANAVKYLTSRFTLAPVTDQLQAELIAAVYLRFIRQLGTYLIEMNSGRLRGGADHYRRTFGQAVNESDSESESPPETAAQVASEPVTVALVGQVKSGKSSLVNALVGDRVAQTDVLPETAEVTRYQMTIPDSSAKLTLLDTPGYADAGATPQQVQAVRQTLESSDVVLLVLDAHSPARAADRALMDELQKWFQSHTHLKPPPALLCLTHIDLLSPVMEWDPPYDWDAPKSRKEHSVHDAIEHVRSLFSDVSSVVIPMCTDVERGRQTDVLEDVLPALMNVLRDGQAVALLRTFHQSLDRGRTQIILRQLRKSGQALLKAWMEERFGPGVLGSSSSRTSRNPRG